jgi:hypothetical protein
LSKDPQVEDEVPFTSGGVVATSGEEVVAEDAISGELLRVNDDVSASSSGIVANFFRTCLSAGRRIGLL